MAQDILLITLDDILHYTQISGVVDVYKINPHIFNSQILYVEPILGSSLYDKLLTLVDTGDINLLANVNYSTLLFTYVTPSLALHAVELFIPLNSFQLADGGTFQMTPTNANFSPMNEIDKLANKYRIIGEKYDTKLEKYLCENSDLFPEYTNNTGLIEKTEATPRCGIYLGMNHSKSKIRR